MLIQDNVSIGANATNVNVLTGSIHEFLAQDAVIEFGLAGSATGVRVDISIGGRVIAQNVLVNANNRIPIYPDDFNLTEGGLAGERIVIQGRNTTGGALTLNWAIKITPG